MLPPHSSTLIDWQRLSDNFDSLSSWIGPLNTEADAPLLADFMVAQMEVKGLHTYW